MEFEGQFDSRNSYLPEEVKVGVRDTGAYNLCINETLQEQLDLPFIEKRKAMLANGLVAE